MHSSTLCCVFSVTVYCRHTSEVVLMLLHLTFGLVSVEWLDLCYLLVFIRKPLSVYIFKYHILRWSYSRWLFKHSHALCTRRSKSHAEDVMFVKDFLPQPLANHHRANIYRQSLCSANALLQMYVWCHLVTSDTEAERFKSTSRRLMYRKEQLP